MSFKKVGFIFQPLALLACTLSVSACSESALMKSENGQNAAIQPTQKRAGKPVVYQVFTRLYGNQNTTNKPWGTLEENGVGKFNDFTPAALASIKALGTSHIWYTGVPHHALVTDYSDYGITGDDPDVVKGRAGSPYAVKDYYSVNPDLAVKPANRLAEFTALVARTHDAGMQVIIDIVPNHVARDYQSLSAPQGVEDFGASDNTAVEYARDNNFYYVVNEAFKVPASDGYVPLGGAGHPKADGKFDEFPAKWTGNGARAAQPDSNDWYETVKVNYGVKPDGTYDFPRLPDDYAGKSIAEHAAFWADKALPDSWYKFRDIAHYWLDKGVDGFRYDMAEMVPVEFWSFLNSSIKQTYPDAFLLAEVYQPQLYRDYLQRGKMGYLYDKVGFYDTLKRIMQHKANVSELIASHEKVSDIAPHMLHFLENHDEQRIASPAFAGSGEHGKPALAVSTLISSSPTLLYFGQDVGEDGSEDMGFGDPSRTTIFDYAGVPAHQRFMNGGKFDGGNSTPAEKALREFYVEVMAIAANHPAVNGELIGLHAHNLANTESDTGGYSEQQFAFIRKTKDGNTGFIVVANFAEQPLDTLNISIPAAALSNNKHSIKLKPLLSHEGAEMVLTDDNYVLTIPLDALETRVFAF